MFDWVILEYWKCPKCETEYELDDMKEVYENEKFRQSIANDPKSAIFLFQTKELANVEDIVYKGFKIRHKKGISIYNVCPACGSTITGTAEIKRNTITGEVSNLKVS